MLSETGTTGCVKMTINELGRAALAPDRCWALFLDLDGTLLDIAEAPEAVAVPETLMPMLNSAADWLGGALAVVSGRMISEIDRVLVPLQLPCAGEHGAEIRLPDGAILGAGPECAVPEVRKAHVQYAVRHWEGVSVEAKKFNMAVHYRRAPARRNDVRRLLERTIDGDGAGFEILPALMAFELRHRSVTKGSAVRVFMQHRPFAGRIPVFVGDDATDEDGFRAAEELGGLALRVSDVFGGDPGNVRRWLGSFSAGGGNGDRP